MGYSDSASGNEAFRWTSSGGMVGLGDLPGGGFSSDAFGVSYDGSVVVGQSSSTSTARGRLFFGDSTNGMQASQVFSPAVA